MPPPSDVRDRPDQCPGVLRPHQAADGALVRLRVPGGRLRAPTVAALRAVAAGLATPEVHLTSRGNVQLRGVPTTPAGDVHDTLVASLRASGLLPSTTHERVRNLVASPLSGLSGGHVDIRPLIRSVDAELSSDPLLARLPGRFLFALDDGRGDVVTLRPDLAARGLPGGRMQVLVGDRAGPVVGVGEVVTTLLGLARRFLELRGSAWRVAELPAGGPELLEGGGRDLSGTVVSTRSTNGVATSLVEPVETIPLGRIPQGDGNVALSLAVPLGRLTVEQLGALADVASAARGEVVVTPWRGVVVPGVDAPTAASALESLTASGLVADAGSPWSRITACVGAPGCARASADTRVAAVRQAEGASLPLPVHVVACARACGAPTTEHELVLLPGGRPGSTTEMEDDR
ncbi:MAG: precorrin-3B synthase [Nocardioides sp.]